jgi:SAM-dependent methyltransferase
MTNDGIRAKQINQAGWDLRVDEGDRWTRPVGPEIIERARRGDWRVVLTPAKPVPMDWFGELAGLRILCLASGGGQQGPILAAAGAQVTVFDASHRQLAQDRAVAERDGLVLATRQGFMDDLGCFDSGQFDLVFNPVSNCYAPDVVSIWRECFRVLKPGGFLLAAFMNPTVYVFDPDAEDRGEMRARFRLPYADIKDLPQSEFDGVLAQRHTVEFSHSLESQIGGQLRAGFVLLDLYEDAHPGRLISEYFPVAIATRAVKPRQPPSAG